MSKRPLQVNAVVARNRPLDPAVILVQKALPAAPPIVSGSTIQLEPTRHTLLAHRVNLSSSSVVDGSRAEAAFSQRQQLVSTPELLLDGEGDGDVWNSNSMSLNMSLHAQREPDQHLLAHEHEQPPLKKARHYLPVLGGDASSFVPTGDAAVSTAESFDAVPQGGEERVSTHAAMEWMRKCVDQFDEFAREMLETYPELESDGELCSNGVLSSGLPDMSDRELSLLCSELLLPVLYNGVVYPLVSLGLAAGQTSDLFKSLPSLPSGVTDRKEVRKRRWTAAESKEAEELARNMTVAEVAGRLDRSTRAVRDRLSLLRDNKRGTKPPKAKASATTQRNPHRDQDPPQDSYVMVAVKYKQSH